MVADTELLNRWGDGDDDAGGELFARYFNGLFRFFATKVDDEVDDLVQATFLNCVKYRARLQKAESFKAYLYTIARRRLYQYLTTKIQAKAIDFATSSIVDLGGSLSSIVGRRDDERMLLAALRSLPVELQVLLELHYWEGMTVDESAQVLEVPLGTAKTRLRRARVLLRDRLGGDADALEQIAAGSSIGAPRPKLEP